MTIAPRARGANSHRAALGIGVLVGLAPGQVVTVVLTDPQGATRTVTIALGQLPGS